MILELRAAFDRLFRRRRRPRSIEIYVCESVHLGCAVNEYFFTWVGVSVCGSIALLRTVIILSQSEIRSQHIHHFSPLDTQQTQLTFSTGETLTE